MSSWGVLFEEGFSIRGAWLASWELVCELAKRMPDGKQGLSIVLRSDPAAHELNST